MNIETNGIRINLDADEIRPLWNVILFALDFKAQEEKAGKPCMTEDEYVLAKKLASTLESII